jgi:succinate dehydrogenase / fumarate reductase cytochrome b subunit
MAANLRLATFDPRASMQALLRLWHSTIGKKIAMAVSGILLVGFLVSHVVSNLFIFINPDHLDAYGRFLRSTGPLLWVARIGLILLAIIHITAALQLIQRDAAARPEGYARPGPRGSRLLALGMRVSGVLLVVFLVIHLMNFTWGSWHPAFEHGKVGQNVIVMFSAWHGMAAFYIVAMAALGLHLGHGVWSFFQTMGMNHGAWNSLRWPIAILTAVAIAGGFAVIPLAIWMGWL